MRIAFIHPRFPSAEGTGATHSATQIVTGLADAGHNICVYCTCPPKECLDAQGIELRYLGKNSSHPHTDTRLNKEILDRKEELQDFEIVHSYLPRLIPSITQVGKKQGVATVVTLNAYGGTCAKNSLLYRNKSQCHNKSTLKCLSCITSSGFKDNENGYMYETISELLSLRLINSGEARISNISGFHALSPHVKRSYTEFGYVDEKIEVIPNILDTRFDLPNSANFMEPFQLLYVGALKKSKGADRLIDIISRVSKQSKDCVKLTIIGDGELRTSIEEEATTKGVSEIVEIKGQVPYAKLPKIYASHDLFVYPGRWNEPFGRVFLEAMATGTPIVATDVGSVNDIVENAGIVSKQSVPDITENILDILDREKLQACSVAGRRQIKKYRISEIIPQFERLYADALGY